MSILAKHGGGHELVGLEPALLLSRALLQKDVCATVAKARRVYRLVASGALLMDLLTQQLGEQIEGEKTLPSPWAESYVLGRRRCLTKLLLTLPIPFSDFVIKAAAGTTFVLPGPFGTGSFRALLMIQRLLHPDLATSVEQVWLPAGVVGTAECWALPQQPSSTNTCQELADTLRAVLPNQQPAVVELFPPWIARLQCFYGVPRCG